MFPNRQSYVERPGRGRKLRAKIEPSSVKSYFPLADANGNAVTYIDNAGNVQAHYTYDAFGGTASQTGDMDDAFRFRFSSKYLDDETGLYYYGYRYLSPELGRWVNRDPIWEESFSQMFFADIRGELKKVLAEIESLDFTQEYKLFKNDINALFQQEISVYSYVENMTMQHYDYLGLQDPCEIMDCIDRCMETSKIVIGSPEAFVKWCIDQCYEDPKFVPNPLKLVAPPTTKPSWSFSKPKSNWKKILTALKNIAKKLKDNISERKGR